MKIAVSDLLFPGFRKEAMRKLSADYGIEFFYEFGKDYYWNEELAAWGKRSLSIHGPCVALNLADEKQEDYLKIFEQTFAYAQKVQAEFVVVHTNEAWQGDKKAVQDMVIARLRRLIDMAKEYSVKVVIENVGLRTKNNVLFNLDEYLALFDTFTDAYALIDTGHANVNGWDIPAVIEKLNSKLLGCHVHDNSGNGDEHLPIGQGNIDWVKYFDTVKKFAPQATQVLEYSCGFNTAAELEEDIANICKEYGMN